MSLVPIFKTPTIYFIQGNERFQSSLSDFSEQKIRLLQSDVSSVDEEKEKDDDDSQNEEVKSKKV